MRSINIKMVIEYDGTHYRGWQLQPGGPTVQEQIELALKRITGESVCVAGAGRTDAGVHARGQVASVQCATRLTAARLHQALNAVLPDDIAILDVGEAPPDFHARFSARGKRYRYAILNRSHRSALDHRFAHHVRHPLDIDTMRAAARHLVGTHDFSSFACNSGRDDNPLRTVSEITIESQGEYVILEIEAVSFLYKMVRSIVGALIEAGKGAKAPEDIRAVLAARDRSAAPATAPARGLTLMRVSY
ncbi:MAG: tRNA pseudouridine(38-40) synthase TruA [Candidatus Aureabacteria bacterium]|nr:tRNA pseudouridine(38-40) synthase TruA [Candidatus Auribacterota bacterium]